MYPSAGPGEGRPVMRPLIPRRDQPPRPAPPRQKLVDDHLADVGFRAVQLADLLPPPAHPDQHLLHQVLGKVWISSHQPPPSGVTSLDAARARRVCSPAAG